MGGPHTGGPLTLDAIVAEGLVKVYRSRIVSVVVLVAIFAPLGVLRYRSMSR